MDTKIMHLQRSWIDPLIVSNVVFLVPAYVFYYIGLFGYTLLYVAIAFASTAYHRHHEQRYMALDMFFATQAFVYCIAENIIIYKSIILGYFNVLCVAFYPFMIVVCKRDKSMYCVVHFMWHVCVGVGSLVWAMTSWQYLQTIKQ